MADAAPTQPDIAYVPNFSKYKERTARRLGQGQLSQDLPPGFPTNLDSPLCWKPSDFASEDEWVYELTATDLSELHSALTHFKELSLPLGKLSQSTFPLARLGPTLRALSKDLHQGRGFFVLRNFPVDAYSRLDTVIAYTGVASYVGSLRGQQDHTGAVLVHITDLSGTHNVGTPAYTNDKQVFHTDNGDIVALLALEAAAEGGTSFLASSWQVYNILAATRPDLIRTLSEDWPCDGFNGDPPYYMRPVMYFTAEQRLIIQYFRRLFTGFGSLARPVTIPPISEAQAEALDALQFVAEENALRLTFQKGDVQFINNLSIFHARDGYTDSAEKKRHLLRFWLRDEEYGWLIPDRLKDGPGRSWKVLKHRTTDDSHRFPLEPEVKKEAR